MATVPLELTKFVQLPLVDSPEVVSVVRVATALLEHLRTADAETRILAVNQPGAASQLVQDAFLKFAHALGFSDERIGLFLSYESAVRPDYFLPRGDTGILLEVERGKTTINNMDLLSRCPQMTLAEPLGALTNLHDRVVIKIAMEWAIGIVTIELKGTQPSRIIADGVTELAIPRLLEWGPSASINAVSVVRHGANLLQLAIEMQTGDVISIRASSVRLEC